ncbi:UDP-N-acetylmuramoyl-L-alanine--D-glutamate ligase [Synechococcus sp. BS55D]|uniref:UDP-N-acetylmuramoyl-L-alanine--D-glutamate ligase n=1 Tax=Synechococcus sp. BS55D TaxID=2055943 RepID=UPI001038711C|nr:UDP-N-acetylmuramoyl-L-alanine--D-glutamate ligase [Synechococcus sp. BS55D]TCD55702.1 UDP-N-acetylmuramoyl-L-alanine--D-glutamate ligase [Synechococcus sp. BS55D]
MARTVVVGLGRSGVGAARLLRAQGLAVTVLERDQGASQEEKAQLLRAEGIDVQLGRPLTPESFTPWLNAASPDDGLAAVVVSPGIAWDHPTLNQLRSHGVSVLGEMAVAWHALQMAPWIGITGTNGKTTVTQLLQHVLSHGGLTAPMAGNVGNSAAELALLLQSEQLPCPDWVVMEMSSYQIEAAATVAPRIGIWTTLTPDHLERHGTLEAYRSIKRSLLERSQVRIFNADDPDLLAHRASWSHGIWISAAGPGEGAEPADLWCDENGTVQAPSGPLFPASALAMPGAHNRQNMLMVTAAALEVGLDPGTIEAGLRSFPGVPHRLERLGLLEGMDVFNDSKATNYDAAVVALRSVPGPIVVLAGGQTKQGDAREWLRLMQEHACAAVLYGRGAEELKSLLKSSDYSGVVESTLDLNTAVPLAIELGRRQKAASLLLSPACASFDQYRDFEARGDHFRTLISARLSP